MFVQAIHGLLYQAVENVFFQRPANRMLKKGFPALFQLGSSRSEFATASEHQQLGVIDVRASHPWLALTGR